MTKTNKKFMIRGLILFIIISILLLVLNTFIIYFIPNERFRFINQINHTEGIEILILGNSHAQEGINSNLMSQLLNAKVYNFSFSQQESAAAYYSLKKLLEANNPKTVILEAYTLIQKVEGAYDYIPLSLEKIKYYKMLGVEASFQDVFLPIIRLHNFWTNPNIINTILDNTNSNQKPPKPHFTSKIMSYKAIGRHEKYNSNENAKQLNINRLNNILEIKKLCNENKAKLVLTMIPWYETLVDKINYNERYYYPLKVFCDTNSIPFFDMNVNSEENWEYYYFREQDYTQNTHLNAYGQHKASCELAYYLDSIDENLTLTKASPQLTKLNDYLSTIDNNNDVLIIDKCPNPIDPKILLLVKDEFERLCISPSQELDKDINIQYFSGGKEYDEFTNHQNMHSEELAVNIYELDKDTKEIISHVITRWDVFDTVFWIIS